MSASILPVLLLAAQQITATDTLVIQLNADDVALEVREGVRIGSLSGPPETTFGRVGRSSGEGPDPGS